MSRMSIKVEFNEKVTKVGYNYNFGKSILRSEYKENGKTFYRDIQTIGILLNEKDLDYIKNDFGNFQNKISKDHGYNSEYIIVYYNHIQLGRLINECDLLKDPKTTYEIVDEILNWDHRKEIFIPIGTLNESKLYILLNKDTENEGECIVKGNRETVHPELLYFGHVQFKENKYIDINLIRAAVQWVINEYKIKNMLYMLLRSNFDKRSTLDLKLKRKDDVFYLEIEENNNDFERTHYMVNINGRFYPCDEDLSPINEDYISSSRIGVRYQKALPYILVNTPSHRFFTLNLKDPKLVLDRYTGELGLRLGDVEMELKGRVFENVPIYLSVSNISIFDIEYFDVLINIEKWADIPFIHNHIRTKGNKEKIYQAIAAIRNLKDHDSIIKTLENQIIGDRYIDVMYAIMTQNLHLKLSDLGHKYKDLDYVLDNTKETFKIDKTPLVVYRGALVNKFENIPFCVGYIDETFYKMHISLNDKGEVELLKGDVLGYASHLDEYTISQDNYFTKYGDLIIRQDKRDELNQTESIMTTAIEVQKLLKSDKCIFDIVNMKITTDEAIHLTDGIKLINTSNGKITPLNKDLQDHLKVIFDSYIIYDILD